MTQVPDDWEPDWLAERLEREARESVPPSDTGPPPGQGCLGGLLVVGLILLVIFVAFRPVRDFFNHNTKSSKTLSVRLCDISQSGRKDAGPQERRTELALVTDAQFANSPSFLVDEGVHYSNTGKPSFADKDTKKERAADFPRITIGAQYELSYSQDFMFGAQMNVHAIHPAPTSAEKLPDCP